MVQPLTVEVGPSLNLGFQGMLVGTSMTVKLRTPDAPGFVDVTEHAVNAIEESGVQFGLMTGFSRHTTAALVIQENESMLKLDIEAYLERLAPRNGYYHHNDFDIRTENMTQEESPNGHAHLQHMVLGAGVPIPIINSQMALGRWQRLFLIELDEPRDREVLFQVFGISLHQGGK